MNRLFWREWKGNIRELAHLIEQAVIVSEGTTLDFSTILSPSLLVQGLPVASRTRTMRDFEHDVTVMERELILDALSRSKGRVSGAGGAAEQLALHPKTLYSRIEKLGLNKRYS